MDFPIEEALRYMGAAGADAAVREHAAQVAHRLSNEIRPSSRAIVFPVERSEERVILGEICLPGKMASTMLSECREAALLACTLGFSFDSLLRTEQARNMADAVILDACGSAYVEAACDQLEENLLKEHPGKYLTDRFSPGYGDLPLGLQAEFCRRLHLEKTMGITVRESMLLSPMKTVTAVVGISDKPQKARIRGCEFCSFREDCTYRKEGKRCDG